MSEDSTVAPVTSPKHFKDAMDNLATLVSTVGVQQGELAKGVQRLAEYQDQLTEELKETNTQMGLVIGQMHGLVQRLATPPQGRWTWLTCGGWTLAVLVATTLLWGWWQYRDDIRYGSLGRAVDWVVVQHYPWLPKATQEQLSGVYRVHGVRGPGARQKVSK